MFQKKTVASITKQITKMAADLEAVAGINDAEADRITDQIEKLKTQRGNLQIEAVQADTVAANLRALTGDV